MNSPNGSRNKMTQLIALGCLLVLGALALAGPYGLLSWSENAALLENREARIAELRQEQVVLENRVTLLDPDNVDPDFASELVRHNLNVAHRDEYVFDLDTQP